jgi:hypothetical protein
VVHPAINLDSRPPRHDPCYPNIVTSSCLARMPMTSFAFCQQGANSLSGTQKAAVLSVFIQSP